MSWTPNDFDLDAKLEYGFEVTDEEVNGRMEQIKRDGDYSSIASILSSNALNSVEHARIILIGADKTFAKSIDLRLYRSYTQCISSLCERLPEKDLITLLDERISKAPGCTKVMEMLDKDLWERYALTTLLMVGLRQWMQDAQELKSESKEQKFEPKELKPESKELKPESDEDGVICLFKSLPTFVREYLLNGTPCAFIRAIIDRSIFTKTANDTQKRLLWLVEAYFLTYTALIEQISLCNGNRWQSVMSELLEIANIGRTYRKLVTETSSVSELNHELMKSFVHLDDELMGPNKLEVLLLEMYKGEQTQKSAGQKQKLWEFIMSYESAEEFASLRSRLEEILIKYKPATVKPIERKEEKIEELTSDSEDTDSTLSEGLNEERIAWVDCKMTGVDMKKDTLVEIAVIMTDGDRKVIAEGPDIVIQQSEEMINSMTDSHKRTFEKIGLMQRIRNSKVEMKEAEDTVLEFLTQHIPAKKCPLEGNSVYVDRQFISKCMPRLGELLHYSIVDVSMSKEGEDQ